MTGSDSIQTYNFFPVDLLSLISYENNMFTRSKYDAWCTGIPELALSLDERLLLPTFFFVLAIFFAETLAKIILRSRKYCCN
jgi:hypothetical protein